MQLVQAVSVQEFNTHARTHTHTHTGGCMRIHAALEVFVQLHAPTDLPLERAPPPSIIHFHMRLFVSTASKDVVAMM
jgi:hypothetical protein